MYRKIEWTARGWTRIGAVPRALWLPAVILAIPFSSVLGEDDVSRLRAELEASRTLISQLQETVQTISTRLEAVERTERKTDNSGVAERVDDLEMQLFETQDALGSTERAIVKAFDAKRLMIGGFLSQQFTSVFGEDDAAHSFNATQLEILLRADISEKLSFFAAQGFLWETGADAGVINPDDPSPAFAAHSSKTPLILGDFTYRHSDALLLQFGRMVTPHGIINIEHFPPTLLDARQPMFLRPFGGETIFPNFIGGAQAKGKIRAGDTAFTYNVYAGTRNTGAAPSRNGEAINVGARFALELDESGIDVGLNLARGERGSNKEHYQLIGLDFLFDKGPWLWKNEVFQTHEDGGENRIAFYTQPAYRLNDQWIAFYRFDYLDDGSRFWPRNNPGIAREHTLGINFLPFPVTRIRATATQREHEGIESFTTQLSATVSF